MNLREQVKDMDFQYVHLDYLLAMSDVDGGMQLVSDLIEVYLERAPRILFWVNNVVDESDYVCFKGYLKQLGEASERIGAIKLADSINIHLYGKDYALMNVQEFLTNIFNEFSMVKYELDALAVILRRLN